MLKKKNQPCYYLQGRSERSVPIKLNKKNVLILYCLKKCPLPRDVQKYSFLQKRKEKRSYRALFSPHNS